MFSSRFLILTRESVRLQCPPFLRNSDNLLYRLGPCQSNQFHGYATSPNYNNKKPYKLSPLADKSLDSHSWSKYILPAALLVICGAGVFLRYNDERRVILTDASIEERHEDNTQKIWSHRDAAGNKSNTINRPAIGGPFSLISTEFQLVSESDLRGNWIIMYFGCTSSPDVDPQEIQKMARVVDLLEREQKLQMKPVFITIDPQRDSPSHLRAYLQEFDPRIIGLTGPPDAIRQMAMEYRVYFKKVDEDGKDYLVESSHNKYLMDPNMEIVRCFGLEYNAEQLVSAILKEVKAATDKQVDTR